MRAGDTISYGFVVAEAREGYYAASLTLPNRAVVNFAAKDEAGLLARVESWGRAQESRKDGGALKRPGVKVLTRGGPKPSPTRKRRGRGVVDA